MNIGIELKMEKSDLDEIQDGNKENDKCFIEMLIRWLRNNPRPMLADLTAALKQPTVGFHQLAEELEREGLRKCTGSNHDHTTKVEPEERQRSEMIRRFEILRQGLFDTIEDKSDRITRHTRHIKAFLKKNNLKEPNNIGEVQKIIEEHSSFNNYDLVEDMIEVTGTETDKLRCKKYLKEFSIYEKQIKRKSTPVIIQLGAPVLFAIIFLIIYYLVSVYHTHIFSKNCFATGRGLEVATVGEKANVDLYITNQGVTVHSKVTCDVIYESTGKKFDCGVKKTAWKVSPYEISYQPTSRGRHQLHIKVEGEHIKGSPFNVTVLKTLGATEYTIDKLERPQGITFNQAGHLIVAEYTAHRVSIFSKIREKILEFGSQGSEPGQFYYPCDVAVDDDDNILVADKKNNRIQKFNREGIYITTAGKQGTKPGEFHFPVGIAIHLKTKKIFVSEEKNHRIQILNPDLTFYRFVDGIFNEPKRVAFDSAGKVYVADTENHCIKVFTEDGDCLTKFGTEGIEEGQLTYPSSIIIDVDDVLYIPELYTHRVSVFTTNGIFLKSFGTEGYGPGQFMEPRGIAVDNIGNVYISDRANNRIRVF